MFVLYCSVYVYIYAGEAFLRKSKEVMIDRMCVCSLTHKAPGLLEVSKKTPLPIMAKRV